MEKIRDAFSGVQIRALLKKDVLVRLRQPWMTVVQILWPCMIFIALYILRNRFTPSEIGECQYPTRLLPAKNHLLPFFHSYICTIENACSSPDKYEEITTFDDAPLKPILNIVQTFLNEDALFNVVVDLPTKMNFVSAVTTLVTHSKFKSIEENVNKVVESIPRVEQMLGGNFDITKLFADDRVFSNSGKVICNRPFPRSDNIRFIDQILYTEDFKGANDDELDAMPTKYCKQLYLDVTNTNNGKMTWKQIKPIIQGKILYGPPTDENAEIIKLANATFEEMNRLKVLTENLDLIFTKLHTDEKFKTEYRGLLNLLKSPVIKGLLGSSVDVEQVESVMNRIETDEEIAKVIRTVYNIFECFSADRFIPVENEQKLEEQARILNDKKLFYAGIYFTETSDKSITYKFRMESDNTPITLETRNRLWFPGPEGSFAEDMRYHRGFIQIKHALDTAIIRYKKKKQREVDAKLKQLPAEGDPFNSGLNVFGGPKGPTPASTIGSVDDLINDIATVPPNLFDDDFDSIESTSTSVSLPPLINFTTNEVIEKEKVNETTTAAPARIRKKRAPQFDSLLGLLFGGDKKDEAEKFDVDDVVVYTKQFPYPAYQRDDFKKGIYLAQSVQMAFFVALIVQVATCIQYRVWMKESRNTMLMRSMGLKATSEIITWTLTTFIEILITFFLACIILYSGGILIHTSFFFILFFLLFFGFSVISFCYMCSTFFSMASIASVASAILFLITFMPYIIILALGATIGGFVKFIVNLSMSTAFCYAWRQIMQTELQGTGMSFSEAFGGVAGNDFKSAFFMIILDIILYAVIGFVIERFKSDEYKFYQVETDDMESNIGGHMQNVSKIYDTGKVAVSNVSLLLPRDHVTCLLGRNGAGKSTIIKMLTGQIKPTSGKVVLSDSHAEKANMDKIGFCSQDNIIIPHLTAKEHLELYARIKLKGGFQLEVSRTMKNLNFGKYEDFEACQLSGGFQRRLCVAIAFIGSPNVVILDEPCSGVDTKARKCVWELIEALRKGRAVVLATHYLDEAEYLSDSVIIMNEGKVIAEHSPESLKDLFTKTFDIIITTVDENRNDVVDEISKNIKKFTVDYQILEANASKLAISVPYKTEEGEGSKCSNLIEYLEDLKSKQQIRSFYITSRNLGEMFNSLNQEEHVMNGRIDGQYVKIDLSKKENFTKTHLSNWEIVKNLFWKRMLHFRRNYRLLLCILGLPIVFEVLAMAFMQLRPNDDYSTSLPLSRDLYPESTQFLGIQTETDFTKSTYDELFRHCSQCSDFNSSDAAFKWILDTTSEYRMRRYGGLTFNNSNAFVWYNNKGHHSMAAWLNDLNSYMLKAEMDDPEYEINSYNHPLKLGVEELSTSSILQQVADSGIALILIIAFSLVVAGSSVFIVNERVSGEKLQQKLCGVSFKTYWGVAFAWDFIIYLIAMLLCVIVFKIFNIPTYVAKSNLDGICLLLVLYGFATIPAVHLFEKLFSEASFANMSIFCMNVIIALTTLTVILLFDVLGDSDTTDAWRKGLNRAFLIFPQHALSDGLIEICKNHIMSEVFIRYDIDSYKSPISSKLLHPHFISLFIMGVIFMALNFSIESGFIRRVLKTLLKKGEPNCELQIISIQNSLKRDDKYSTYSENYAVKVENLYKAYRKKEFAVRDVTFEVRNGECFGLLGNNGAGKSTIFGILSGQMSETLGSVKYFNRSISFCPQTSALDPLLTVREVVEFYGRLRKIVDIPRLTASTLKSFHLEEYRDVLVKNLSGGNRRKLNVAVACMGDTSIVLMDEPTSDMDPVTRSLVYQAINELVSERRSVLMTSHTISEIDNVCHRIGVLKDGRLVTVGSPNQLKDKFGGYYVVTIFFDKIEALSIEREISAEFASCHELKTHSHSLKFIVKVKLKKSDEENGEIVQDDGSVLLSELFAKLAKFCNERSIQFTITRCQLDKTFENILDSMDDGMNTGMNGGYIHKGFTQSETVT